MTCPYCGGSSFLSRHYEDAARPHNVRICLGCGRRFITYELLASVVDRQALQLKLHDILTRNSRPQARAMIQAHNGGGL